MISNELNQRIQKIADLLVDIVWDDNDILQTSQKITNVKTDKVDPDLTEHYNYGSN